MDDMRTSLFYEQKNGYDLIGTQERKTLEDYCLGYMEFLNNSRTEREAVKNAIAMAEERGFVAYVPGMELRPGMKLYYNNRGKALMLAVIGRKDLGHGAVIAGAHVDAPRLDLKQIPMYESDEMCFFRTHYYGGIKKYQWVTIPLELHGVVALKNGDVIDVSIGREPDEPKFVITDLLPHLAADQMKKTMSEGITGEQLNVILGTAPLSGDEGADRVKLAVMNLLNEKYGLIEEDFLSAELTIVPAGKAREVGLDRSLLGAYGHDDRVCSFAALLPILSLETPDRTAVCVLADKEEIGSVGISGMQSQCFESFMADLCDSQNVSVLHCFENSFCLSADVTNAFDPNFAETCDKRNNSKLNYGVGICKYTGSRGKGGASDAAAEAMGYVRSLFEANGVVWQAATLGKVDQGGGGTVAAYMANRNIVTVDAGVPVLCMHAPWELVSKYDCYMTMKAMTAVYKGL